MLDERARVELPLCTLPRCFSWTGFVNLPRGKLGDLSCISTVVVEMQGTFPNELFGSFNTGSVHIGHGEQRRVDRSLALLDVRRPEDSDLVTLRYGVGSSAT